MPRTDGGSSSNCSLPTVFSPPTGPSSSPPTTCLTTLAVSPSTCPVASNLGDMSEPDQPETPPPPSIPPPPSYGAYPAAYPPAPPPYTGYAPPPSAPSNGLGIASLVTAIIALLSVVGGIVLGVVAVLLGFL